MLYDQVKLSEGVVPDGYVSSRQNRVALSRLVEFECTWLYADGIVNGIVWVVGGETSHGLDNAEPCWYHCVDENIGSLKWRGDHWYRRFVLFEMTHENLLQARSLHSLQSMVKLIAPTQCHRESGMPMISTPEFKKQRAEFMAALGDDHCFRLAVALPVTNAEIMEAKMHTGILKGWFQR
jgi:hypothetical protein